MIFISSLDWILTCDLQIGSCSLRSANTIGDLTNISACILRLDRIDDQVTVCLDSDPSLHPRDRHDGACVPVPWHRQVARCTLSFTDKVNNITFSLVLVQRRICYNCTSWNKEIVFFLIRIKVQSQNKCLVLQTNKTLSAHLLITDIETSATNAD